MLVKGQTGLAKVHHSTIDRYIGLGYKIDHGQKEIIVKAEHLPKSSPIVLNFSCDECGEVYRKKRSSQHKLKRDLCEKCRADQAREKFVKRDNEIKVYGRSKVDCYKKVIRAEGQGYECCFPIQRGEGIVDKHTDRVETYYYTVMRLA